MTEIEQSLIELILSQIQHHLNAIKQWANMGEFERAAYHQTCAVSLIEILEIHTCGSTGGFGKGQTNRTIQGRFKYLQNLFNT